MASSESNKAAAGMRAPQQQQQQQVLPARPARDIRDAVRPEAHLDRSVRERGTARTVPLRSLLGGRESRVADNATAIFVESLGSVYCVHPGSAVPEGSAVVRTASGQVCGLPAVTGG